MFRSPSGRKLASSARAARRLALVISLFAVAGLPYVKAGAWQQEAEEVRLHKSQPGAFGQANIIKGAEFVPGEMLVRFRSDAEAKSAEATAMPLRTQDGGEVTFEYFGGSETVRGLRLAKVDPARTLEAVAELASRPDVLYAEPNYIWRAKRTPNDPRYVSGEMYGLNKIGAPAAWNMTIGNRNVVVGVLDGGVDTNHEDLRDNIWTNPGEVPNNNFDDDGNGLIDDVHGWDFEHNDKTIFDGEDGDDHATHVAGTIGAEGDNALGVTGVNWEVSIMALKVLGPDGGSISNIIDGYSYALQMRQRGVNIRVLNNSYGGPGKSLAALDAIQQLNAAGILFVVAAGNDARDNFTFPDYPASYDSPNVIAVASTTSTDTLSSFSNFGARVVSIGAPGQSILSTLPVSMVSSGYGTLSGTSMASPHVAGAAALAVAANPNITLTQLRGVLAFTGDRISALDGRTTTGRRLNVANAIASVLENDVGAPATPGDFRVVGQNGRSVTLAWTAPGDDVIAGTAADYDFFFVNPTTQAKTPLPTTLIPALAGTQEMAVVNVPYRNFSGTIQLHTYDNAGNSSTASVAVTIPVTTGSDPYTVALSAAPGLAPMTGTSLVSGDDRYASYNLPFTFPYYGVNRNGLTVSTNGVLYFSTPPRRDTGDADDVPSSVELVQGQTMIAGLWDDIDINTTLRADSGIFVTQPDASRIIFRWQGVTFLSPHVHVNFEIELRSDGTIQMRYGDNPRVFPVVGISGGEPDSYVVSSHTREFVFPFQSIDLTNAQTVTFSPRVASHTISGRVTEGGAGLSEVTLTLSGAGFATTTTNATGDYSFANVPLGGSYTVTPAKPGYAFTPPSIHFANLSTESLTANFTATQGGHVCAQNQAINFGQAIAGTLANGDCALPVIKSGNTQLDGSLTDEYTFTGAAGQQIAVSLTANFDTYLFLLKPDGSVLQENDDINPDASGVPPDTNSRIPINGFIILPTSGTYSILATAFAPELRGAYTLTLTAGANCNLTPIAFGDTKAGTLEAGDCTNLIDNDGTPVDYYTFSGTAGQQIAITMSGTSGNIDPFLYLLTPNGDVIAFDNNGGGGNAARIPPGAGFGRLPATGIYTIVANTLSTSQSGNYNLTLIRAATDCASVPLTSGAPVNGTLANGDCRLLKDGSFIDAYTFTGAANTQIVLTMTSSSSGLVPFMLLLTPTGDELAIDGSSNGDNTARIPGTGTFTLPAPGTYTVLANSILPGQTGNYTLALQKNTHTISGQVTGGGSGLSGVTVSLSGGATATTTTDTSGNYSFADFADGNNYTVTPTDTAQYSFTPQTVTALQADRTVNFTGTLRTYTVSGRVTAGGTSLSGATVTLAGPSGFTPRFFNTLADGNYSFPGVPAGSNYTVTATKANYTFAPPDIAVTNLLADRSGGDFVGTLQMFLISGRIMVGINGLAGASVNLAGSTTGMTQTDANGNYAFSVLAGGTYTVTPTRTNYTFAPASQVFNNLASNQTANFTGTLNTFTISGRVVAGAANLSGVTMTLSGSQSGTTTTDASGNYVFANLPAEGNYTVTAAKLNYTLTPASRTFTNLSGNQTVTNFTATLNTYIIDGRIADASGGLSGVTVSLSGAQAATTTTNANGNYSFSVLAGGTYTVTPSKAFYSFDASNRTFGSITTNQTANFTATLLTFTLSGRVSQGESGLSGVTIMLSGGRVGTATTDAQGNYSFSNLTAGSSVAVTPTRANYTFTPPSRSINIDGARAGINFEAIPVPKTIQFTSSSYQVGEGGGRATLNVTRTGDTSGTATVDYRVTDTDTFTVGCADTVNNNGGAFARCDFANTVGTLSFAPGEINKTVNVPIIDDAHVEGAEAFQLQLSNATGTGTTLGAQNVATVTITDNDLAADQPNPIFTTAFFVRQHYLDFLSREPEAGEPWSAILNGCPNVFNFDPANPSAACDRVIVSQSFFGSPEFRLKGFYVFRFYKLAFDRLPEYTEIVSDMSFVAGATPEEVYARKAQLSRLFTERQEFQTAYGGLSNSAFVAALLGRYQITQITTPDPAQPDGAANVTLTQAALVNRLDTNALTRAQVLRAVADSDEASAREFNNAFVAMQYYGYLRRKPEAAGYEAWLGVLQRGDTRTMVNGFMNSAEFKLRFGHL